MKKIVVDTDGGMDDAFAITMALAASGNLNVLGITTVVGNVPTKQAACNVFRLFDNLQYCKEIPVRLGSTSPLLGHELPESDYHGLDGFGDVLCDSHPCSDRLATTSAVRWLTEICSEHKGEISLVCIGPLTNIALALRYDKDFGDNVKDCFIMGGNMHGKGNQSVSAEFNFHSDPEAADIVLRDLNCPITIATWELCLDHAKTWEWYEQSRSLSTKSARFFHKIESHVRRKREEFNWPRFIACDEIAMAACIDPDVIAESSIVPVHVELNGRHTRGQLVCDWRHDSAIGHSSGNHSVRIVTKLHEERYDQMLLSALLL